MSDKLKRLIVLAISVFILTHVITDLFYILLMVYKEDTTVVEGESDVNETETVTEEEVPEVDTGFVTETVELDSHTKILYVNNVAYLVYSDGYGSSKNTVITPLLDENGNMVLKEEENND